MYATINSALSRLTGLIYIFCRKSTSRKSLEIYFLCVVARGENIDEKNAPFGVFQKVYTRIITQGRNRNRFYEVVIECAVKRKYQVMCSFSYFIMIFRFFFFVKTIRFFFFFLILLCAYTVSAAPSQHETNHKPSDLPRGAEK